MTDTDSSKVIEKLTEVLDLLKAKKETTEKKCEVKCDEKCAVKCDEKCAVKCDEKCPLRKVLSPQEFEDFCKKAESMTKDDLMKMCKKGECSGCPFMTNGKNVIFEEFPTEEVQKQESSRECFQVFNIILSLLLLILFVVFLVRALKGFYCNV
jgi:hypothetical protein